MFKSNRFAALVAATLAGSTAVASAQNAKDNPAFQANKYILEHPERYDSLDQGCKRKYTGKTLQVPILSADGKIVDKLTVRPFTIVCTDKAPQP